MVESSDLLLLSGANCVSLCLFSHSRAGCCLSSYVTGGLCHQGGAGPCQQGDAAVLGGTEEEQYDLNLNHGCS